MVEFNIFAKLASPPPPRKQHSETPVVPDRQRYDAEISQMVGGGGREF